MLYVTKVTRLNLIVFGKANISERLITILTQSPIFAGDAA